MELGLQRIFIWPSFHACLHRLHVGFSAACIGKVPQRTCYVIHGDIHRRLPLHAYL